MTDEALQAFRKAARWPAERFEAAMTLARLHMQRGERPRAVEWMERAAQVPAPTPDAGRQLLYYLGVTLEDSGETARALAVFLELQADAPQYRDIGARVQRLSRVEAGG
jgi:lipopolysaccharide biosynthesis regulator YciM